MHNFGAVDLESLSDFVKSFITCDYTLFFLCWEWLFTSSLRFTDATNYIW